MFYLYTQNNSGGSFIEDGRVSHYVWIEADSEEAADSKAESIGIYFNGVEDDRDCACCGDRWYGCRDSGTDQPMLYGKPISESPWIDTDIWLRKWIAVGRPEGYIYFASGNVAGVFYSNEMSDADWKICQGIKDMHA